MERYTRESDGSVRDRITSPSINFPMSEEEAFQALLLRARKALFARDGLSRPVDQEFTTDAGLGHTRSQQQANWLNEQQSLLRARLEDFLDQLDLDNRINDETTGA